MARRTWLTVLLAAGVSTAALAAEPLGTKEAKASPRRTVIHFGEDDIRGDITRPDGELVQAPRRMTESSLLRVRRSFVDRALSGAARGEPR
jgi:hypothetical protein